MKFNTRRGGGYSATLAAQLFDSSKPIHSLSLDLEPQMKFEDGKRTDEVQAYKAWFTQAGLPPFEVKFEKKVSLPAYLSVVEFNNIEACEVSYNIYFRAVDLKEVN